MGVKKQCFLRKIPVDPMTNSTEWGIRSMQDDADSDSSSGIAVYHFVYHGSRFLPPARVHRFFEQRENPLI